MTRKDPGDFSYLNELRREDFQTPEGIVDLEGMEDAARKLRKARNAADEAQETTKE